MRWPTLHLQFSETGKLLTSDHQTTKFQVTKSAAHLKPLPDRVHKIHITFTRMGQTWGHSDLDPWLLKSNHVITGSKCKHVPHWRVWLRYCIHKNKADVKIPWPFTPDHQILTSPSPSRVECSENNCQGVAGISGLQEWDRQTTWKHNASGHGYRWHWGIKIPSELKIVYNELLPAV